MAKYFTIGELTRSDTAERLGIHNEPSNDTKERLLHLMDYTLDPIREMWGKPIGVNSGYRCPALNRAVGGANNSQHLTGEAADITAGTREDNRKLFEMIQASDIDFDQLIDEANYKWIHVSLKYQRRQVLHLSGK